MEDYKKDANNARKKILEMIHLAGASHIGSNFSCIDVMTVLFSKLNLDKELKENRDRFILSKGWAAASLFYFLSEKGVIPKKDLETYGIQKALSEKDMQVIEIEKLPEKKIELKEDYGF